MALQPWRKGIVTKIENYSPNTKRYWIQVPELDVFEFIPGQFITLDLPIHEKPNKRWRSYSIASHPDGTNIMELVIVLADKGLGTHFIFDNINIGSEFTFRGPQGVFTLPKEIDKDIFLICTGTGIAPFRSMVQSIFLNKTPFKNIYLIFGCRRKEDLLYYNELKELEEKLPGFHYIPTLSREEWEGHHGYVHPIYEEICKEKKEALFFLCGWKNMIDDAKRKILEMGFDKKSIHQELYG